LLLGGVQTDLKKALAGTGVDVLFGADRIFSDEGRNGSSPGAAIQEAYCVLGDNLCSACPRRQVTPSVA
jgi:hypothetical protein